MGNIEGSLWSFRLGAIHLLENLAGGLYADSGASLWEIVRNGVCACFPGSQWIPGVGHVEVSLVKDHPLASGCTSLVVFDRGRGFTSEAIKKFCTIGASHQDFSDHPEGEHGGGSRMRIGRFAAFALNSLCLSNKDVNMGYYILTRTSNERRVAVLPMIPIEIERNQGVLPRFIEPDSSELGMLKGIKGSFTAIVIAHSVFSSYGEIREALKWRIPRKRDQMFKLVVGGERLMPPPLASRVNLSSPDGVIHVHVDKSGNDADGGIWFADAATGLRVAPASQLGRHLVWPYPARELAGDVFVPKLLGNQGTSREGLKQEYLRSKAWNRVCKYLATQGDKIRALIGDEDEAGRSPVRGSILGFIERCNKAFGVPESRGPAVEVPLGEGWKRTQRESHESAREKSKDRSVVTDPGMKEISERKIRMGPGKVVRIGDDVYTLFPRQLGDARVFAEVEGNMIWVNERGYMLPARKEARDEHVENALLVTVAISKFPDQPISEIMLKAADWRAELLGKK